MATFDAAEYVRMSSGQVVSVPRNHNLSRASGRAEMFYVGDAPWHGLGTKVEGSATSAVAIEAAGLGWDVEIRPIQTDQGVAVPMAKAVARKDTGAIFGVVGNRYVPVQNREAFSFLDSLVGEHELEYETAGALGGGERVWMLARVPGELRVAGTEDVTRPYLLLHNTHDGSGSLRCHFTGVRVVCQNTLALANRVGEGQGISLRHVGSIREKIAQARQTLGIAAKVFAKAQENINTLASVKLDAATVSRYFEELIPDPLPDPETQEVSAVALRNAQDARGKLGELFEEGAGAQMAGVRHTMWAAYNSVTEYVDHVTKTTDRTKALTRDARESRLASAWFGPGAQLKSRAFERAMDYAYSVN